MKEIEQMRLINDYLETAYVGARAVGDEECTLRIARAIAAFNADINIDIFTSDFLLIPESSF